MSNWFRGEDGNKLDLFLEFLDSVSICLELTESFPYDFLEDYKKRLPRNRLLVLYCEWGTTSILAGRKLSQYGYDVLSVNGGLQAYRRFSNM
mgnify:CR=1 FL=1